jgi:hypothetical protein
MLLYLGYVSDVQTRYSGKLNIINTRKWLNLPNAIIVIRRMSLGLI